MRSGTHEVLEHIPGSDRKGAYVDGTKRTESNDGGR